MTSLFTNDDREAMREVLRKVLQAEIEALHKQNMKRIEQGMRNKKEAERICMILSEILAGIKVLLEF